jgi:hypothetical protein
MQNDPVIVLSHREAIIAAIVFFLAGYATSCLYRWNKIRRQMLREDREHGIGGR